MPIDRDVILAVHTDKFPWATVSSLTIAGIAATIGLAALVVTLEFRRRDQHANLIARFDAKEFHARMWRLEQMTRRGKSAAHVEPMQLKEVRTLIAGNPGAVAIFHDALATDWRSSRVDMQGIYFFALEVRNTLSRFKWLGRRGAGRLNRAFGYQLLSSFLDHHIVAWRLLPDEGHVAGPARDTYYADNYGLIDPRYVQLVDWLADDLLIKHGNELPTEARQRMIDKRTSIAKANESRRRARDDGRVRGPASDGRRWRLPWL